MKKMTLYSLLQMVTATELFDQEGAISTPGRAKP